MSHPPAKLSMNYPHRHSNGSSLKGCLVFAVILAILLLLATCTVTRFTGIHYVYSEGDRSGTVTKLSRKGALVKTWEGELVMGGVRKGNDGKMDANVFCFSVADSTVISQLQDALNSGETVNLHYKQYFQTAISEGESGYLITSVSQAKK